MKKKGLDIKSGVEIEAHAEGDELDSIIKAIKACQFGEIVDESILKRKAVKETKALNATLAEQPQNTAATTRKAQIETRQDALHLHRFINSVYEDGGNVEITTKPLAPLQTVQTVRFIKQSLLQARDLSAGRARPDATAFAERISQRAGSMDSLNFEPFDGIDRLGEHINISLWANDRNLFADTQLRDSFSSQLESATPADAAMLLNGEDSIAREQCRAHADLICESKNDCKTNNKQEDEYARAEYRMPDGAGNPALSMLLVCSHLYAFQHALEPIARDEENPFRSVRLALKHAIDDILPAPQCDYPDSMDSARTQFRRQSNVMALLETLIDQEVPEETREKWYDKLDTLKAAILKRSELLCERQEGMCR